MVPRARLPRDPAAVQVRSRRPRQGHALEELLDRVVASLVEGGRPGTAALEAAGRAAVGTPWSGYRNGRNRVATLAAAYLRWLAPRDGWEHVGTLEVGGRRPLAWRSATGRLVVDLLDVDGESARLVRPAFGACGELGGPAAVRLLRLGAPTTSLLYTSPTAHEALVGTDYWFEATR